MDEGAEEGDGKKTNNEKMKLKWEEELNNIDHAEHFQK